MAIRVTCGECGHKFAAPDNRAGKSVACDECDETVRVPMPKAAAAPVPKAAAAPVVAAKVVKKKPVVAEDDGDDEEVPTPRRKGAKAEKKKSALPIFVLAGVGLVLVLGLAAGGAYFAMKDGGTAVAPTTPQPIAAPPNSPDMIPTQPTVPEPTAPTKPDPKPTKPDPKPVEPKPVDPDPKPVVRRDSPDRATLERMKKAAVYIEVEDQRGGGGSGSGWFGLEYGLIVTNAHVLGMKALGSTVPKKITVYVEPGEKGKQQKF